MEVIDNNSKKNERRQVNLHIIKGNIGMVKKTTGDQTGMDFTQWIATDHRMTRGAQ